MKLSILLGSTLLFATVLSPMSAYADDQNLQCRRLGNGCDSHNGNGNGKLSISGFDIDVNSSDRSNRNTVDHNTGTRNIVDSTNGNDDTVSAATVSAASADHPDTNAGNENTDTGGGNSTPPQHNSNDIKGYDPFTDGLYGPGT